MAKGKHSERGKALLNDLKSQAKTCLTEATVDDDRADQISNELMYRIAQHWGGQMIYVPMGLPFLASQRDEAIYNKFTGANHTELATEYGLSVPYVYKIVKRMRLAKRAETQPDLFG